MNSFYIKSGLTLFGLCALCFWLPYKSGNKKTGMTTAFFLGLVVLLTFVGQLDFLVIFIWPVILSIQLIFISYWALRIYNKRKIGTVIAMVLSLGGILLILSPWIEDWTFNRDEALSLLSAQNISLEDDFSIIKNESVGFRDYYHTFELDISESDKLRLVQKINSAEDFTKNASEVNFPGDLDRYKGGAKTIKYEDDHYFKTEYYKPNGPGYSPTYRIIKISKTENKLIFEEILD